MAKRTRRLRKKGGMFGCVGRCKRRTARALNAASEQLTGRSAVFLGEREEKLGKHEADKREAEAELAKEKQIAKAADEAREAVAQAAAAKAKRTRAEKAEAEAAAERDRRALEARRAREALQAEVEELEKAIAQLERDEQKASAAVDAARKELGGIAPEDRENADAVVKSKQRVLDKIKAKKEGLEGSLAILKRKSQGGKRFTRRRKTRRRR